MIDKDLSATLDRTAVSDRKATLIVAATTNSLGCNINGLTVNRSSIRRARIRHRKDASTDIRQEFVFDPVLVFHWDGKMLPYISSTKVIERLPVIVTGQTNNKMLGVPKLSSSSGKAQADAVVNCLKDWNVADNVKAMCFDTTSSNTGIHNGAFTRKRFASSGMPSSYL